MLKMLVIYEQPKDPKRFDEHYFTVHVPLIRNLPNLIGFSISRVTSVQNTETPVYLVTELKYANETTFNASYMSPEGRTAQKDTEEMLPLLGNPPSVLIVEELV